jgi:hypothetical protein
MIRHSAPSFSSWLAISLPLVPLCPSTFSRSCRRKCQQQLSVSQYSRIYRPANRTPVNYANTLMLNYLHSVWRIFFHLELQNYMFIWKFVLVLVWETLAPFSCALVLHTYLSHAWPLKLQYLALDWCLKEEMVYELFAVTAFMEKSVSPFVTSLLFQEQHIDPKTREVFVLFTWPSYPCSLVNIDHNHILCTRCCELLTALLNKWK